MLEVSVIIEVIAHSHGHVSCHVGFSNENEKKNRKTKSKTKKMRGTLDRGLTKDIRRVGGGRHGGTVLAIETVIEPTSIFRHGWMIEF